MVKASVVVTLRVEGVHHWPTCPIQDVKFLRDKHRHMFHIKACKPVSHDDRDVEIIMLKREIETFLKASYNGDFGTMSCEEIARKLIEQFGLMFCEVLEDGENGAYLWKGV